MLNKLHKKSEIWFAVAWIIAYCVLMSVGDMLSDYFGMQKSITLIVAVILSLTLIVFLTKSGLTKEYGFNKPTASMRSMFYYLPIIIMLTANLWFGVKINFTLLETILYVFTMLLVGFLEEVIFRGLLFNAIKKSNVTVAIIVSSVTFGIGHIINLINGSGAELIPNILQIIYATAVGFAFVMIYLKSNSLWVCIISHGLFNALSAFSNQPPNLEFEVLSSVILAILTGGYAIYLAVKRKKFIK